MQEEFVGALKAVEDELSLLREALEAASSSSQGETEKSLSALSASFEHLALQLNKLDDAHARHLSSLNQQLSSLRSDVSKLQSGTTALLESGSVPSALRDFEHKLTRIEAGFEASLQSSLRKAHGETNQQLHQHVQTSAASHQDWLAAKLQAVSEMQASVQGLTSAHAKSAQEMAELNKRLLSVVGAMADQKQAADAGAVREKQLEHIALTLEERLRDFEASVQKHNASLNSMNVSLSLMRNSLEAAAPKLPTELQPPLPSQPSTPAPDYQKLFDSLEGQKQLLEKMQASMPYSNQFEEVIKHADLLEQQANEKLDSIQESVAMQAQRAAAQSNEAGQLPSLMRGLSEALGAMSSNLEKQQLAFGVFQRRLNDLPAQTASTDPALQAQLQEFKEGLCAQQQALQEALSAQQAKMQDALSNLSFQLEQLAAVRPSPQLPVQAPASVPDDSPAITAQTRSLSEQSQVLAAQSQLLSQQSQALASLRQQVATLNDRLASVPQLPSTDIAQQLAQLNEHLKAHAQDADVNAVLGKLEDLRVDFWLNANGHAEYGETTVLRNPAAQARVLSEMQAQLQAFKEFELSERAQVALSRMETLLERGFLLARQAETSQPNL